MYEHLLTPGHIGSLRLKNRVVMSPMSTGYAERDGTVTPRLLAHYRERAKGGVGLIICEYSYIDTEFSKASSCQLGVYDDECVSGLTRLAETIKDSGGRAGLQISHVGLQRSIAGARRVAPSPIPWDRLGEPTPTPARELTTDEIDVIIEAFAKAARRVKSSGFDLVEIHGGHGYLITQFLSPLTNRRKDQYGGDLQQRLLFARRVVERVREHIGSDFPLSVRLSQQEFLEGGLSLDDTIQIAKTLAEVGVDAIHVSGGIHRTHEWTTAPMYQEKGIHVDAAKAIRDAVRLPVMVVGSILTPQQAESVLSDGKADFITLGRALLADPHFVRKAAAGTPEEIRPCIRQNEGCAGRFASSGSAGCSVNFAVGRQDEFSEEIERSHEPGLRVVVVGGGPAGLEAARVASLRGHSVVLLERREELGGWLTLASVPEFKAELRAYLEYLVRQVLVAGVEIRTEEATPATVMAEGPDVVILSTGSRPVRPDFPGADRPEVLLATDVFGGLPLGQRVLVAGCDQVAGEAALYLAQQNKRVELVQTAPELAPELHRASRVVLERLLRLGGVTVHVVAGVESVSEDGLGVVDEAGGRRRIPGDNVAIWSGLHSESELLQPLEALGVDVRPVGDCVKPRRIYEAIHEGHMAARRI